MKPRIALTFETGGDLIATVRNLDVLAVNHVRSTMFLYGIWSGQQPHLIKRMVVEGHELGNHTYTHPDLTWCSDEQIRDELRQTDELAQQISGQRAFPWLRPPYGAVDERVCRIASGLGYRIVQRYAVDGTHWPGETTPDTIVTRSLDLAADNAILTFHLGNALVPQALPAVIDGLWAAGFTLVPLSELPVVSEFPESMISPKDTS